MIEKRVTVDFDSESYYLDGEYWESWDNYGEEMVDAINKLLEELYDENKKLSEENEKLKKQLECSREESDDYCEELMGKDEFVRLYKRQRDDALKENKKLKSDNNRLVNETAKIIAEHQGRVLDLIDEKIKEYSSLELEILKELKKEL